MNNKEQEIYNCFISGCRISENNICKLIEKCERDCILILNKSELLTNVLLENIFLVVNDQQLIDNNVAIVLIRIISLIDDLDIKNINMITNLIVLSSISQNIVNQFLSILVKKNIKISSNQELFISLNGDEHLILNILDLTLIDSKIFEYIIKCKKMNLLLEIIKSGINPTSEVFQMLVQEKNTFLCEELLEYGYKPVYEDLKKICFEGKYQLIERIVDYKIIPKYDIYLTIIKSNVHQYIKEKMFKYFLDIGTEINKDVIKFAITHYFLLANFNFTYECDIEIFNLLIFLSRDPKHFNITIPKNIVSNYNDICLTGSYSMIRFLLEEKYFIPNEICLLNGFINKPLIGNLIFEHIKLNNAKISNDYLLKIFLEISKCKPELESIPEIYKYCEYNDDNEKLRDLLEENIMLRKKIKELTKKITHKKLTYSPPTEKIVINRNWKFKTTYGFSFLLNKNSEQTVGNLIDGLLLYSYKTNSYDKDGNFIKIDSTLEKIFGNNFYLVDIDDLAYFVYEVLKSKLIID